MWEKTHFQYKEIIFWKLKINQKFQTKPFEFF